MAILCHGLQTSNHSLSLTGPARPLYAIECRSCPCESQPLSSEITRTDPVAVLLSTLSFARFRAVVQPQPPLCPQALPNWEMTLFEFTNSYILKSQERTRSKKTILTFRRTDLYTFSKRQRANTCSAACFRACNLLENRMLLSTSLHREASALDIWSGISTNHPRLNGNRGRNKAMDLKEAVPCNAMRGFKGNKPVSSWPDSTQPYSANYLLQSDLTSAACFLGLLRFTP